MVNEVLLNNLIYVSIEGVKILTWVFYAVLVFVVLKIASTAYDLNLKVRKKEKITKEIEIVERRKVKPVIDELKTSSFLEKVIREGKVRLVCPEHGCDVQILLDGSIYCPECANNSLQPQKKKRGGRNAEE